MVELAKWCYYTGLFLNDFNNKCHENESVHKLILNDFLYRTGFQKGTTFHLWNQGTAMMLLYGLFVSPKEFWYRFLIDDERVDSNKRHEADRLLFESFKFESFTNFKNYGELDSLSLSKETFLRRFRNAIAHNRVEILVGEGGGFVFSNVDNAGIINFHVKISLPGLSLFLSEIGKYFIDNIGE